jgi:hypothetical protein
MAAKRKARDDVHDAPRKESRIEIGRGFVCHIVDAYGMDETFSKVYKISGLSEEAYGIIYTELEKARDKCNAYFKDDEGAPKVDHRISAFSFMEHPIRYLCGDLVNGFKKEHDATISQALRALAPDDRGTWTKVETASLGATLINLNLACSTLLILMCGDY